MRRSSSRRSMTWASARIGDTWSSSIGWTPSSIASRPPAMTVSGVRSSWVTSASSARRSSRDRSRRSAIALNEAVRPRTGPGPRGRTRTPGSPSARRSVAAASSASGRTAAAKTRTPTAIATMSTTTTATAVAVGGEEPGDRTPSRTPASHVASAVMTPTNTTSARSRQPTNPNPARGRPRPRPRAHGGPQVPARMCPPLPAVPLVRLRFRPGLPGGHAAGSSSAYPTPWTVRT